MGTCIVLRGPLGCGKTTVAQELAKKLGGKKISIDDILDEKHLTSDHEDGYISQASFKKANEIAAEQAISLLKQNIPVVFEGNFYWKSQIDDLSFRLPEPPTIFTLAAPLEVCIDRDRKRDHPHGEDAVRVVHAKTSEFTAGTIVDATTSPDECVIKILSSLSAQQIIQSVI